MKNHILYIVIAILIVCIVIGLSFVRKTSLTEAILSAYGKGVSYPGLIIEYPLNETIFPPDITAPMFHWQDIDSRSNTWLINIQFQDGKDQMNFITTAREWRPQDTDWEAIKSRSIEKKSNVTIIGVNNDCPAKILTMSGISISTSKDVVHDCIFYREVPLPFIDAVKNPSGIKWRFGNISSREKPRVVLENLPVCGNCHSFSRNGEVLGMDVDYANDKGSYIITRVAEEINLAKSKLITWGDYEKDFKEPTFGLLSQVSPDANYVVSTVKDYSVFVPKTDLAFSQLFFPIKGILAFYNVRSKTFHPLPGADDKEFVQSNPAWSPDGKYIVFARSKSYNMQSGPRESAISTPEECSEFLTGKMGFKFDLYRIPFNNGKGGAPEPLEGAANNGMSNFFPKYSPDGRWIVFCMAGNFMLLQPDSQIYIIPAQGGKPRKMKCNTGCMNSWHTWSSNSRWLVFSSKVNSPYTQLFLTHIDDHGYDSPPVLLENFTSSDRASNIPEFVNLKPEAIKKIHEQFVDDISFFRTGISCCKIGDYEAGAQAFKKALALNPQNGEIHYQLGNALDRSGKIDEAVTHYLQAIRLNVNDGGVHYSLAVSLYKLGRIDEAIAHYSEALKDMDNYIVHYSLALVLDEHGKLKEAIEHYKRAIEQNPNHIESRKKLEEALHKLAGKKDDG